MKQWKAKVWGLSAGLLVCAATVWTGPGSNSAFGQNGGGGGGGGGGAGGQRLLMEQLRLYGMSPQERQNAMAREKAAWENLLAFLKEHAPNRYNILMRQQPLPRTLVRMRLIQRWMNMEQTRISEPALYDLMVEQFHDEDHVIGLVAQLRLANRDKNTSVESDLKDQIRAAASTLVKLNLNQRQLQIQHAEEQLDQQKADLARDTANADQLSAQRADQIIANSQMRSSAPQPEPSAAPNGDTAPAGDTAPTDATPTN
jgi:hypothetical protein